jgi:predicted DNA-binding protein
MTIIIELKPDIERRLQRAAERRGVDAPGYVRSLVEENLLLEEEEDEYLPLPKTGAELVASLQKAGVIGAWADRVDISDSSAFARRLRKQAETRSRD